MLHNLTTSLFNPVRSTDQRLQAACVEPVQRLEGRVMLASDRDIVATADFNGDDRQDIVIYRRNAGRNGGGQLRVLLNTGDGYQRADTIAVGRVADVAVGDFNNDGSPDLVVAQRTNLEAVNKRSKARKGIGPLAHDGDNIPDESGGNNAGGGNGSNAGGAGGNNGGGAINDGGGNGGGNAGGNNAGGGNVGVNDGGGNAGGGNNSGGGNGGGTNGGGNNGGGENSGGGEDLCGDQLRPSGLKLLATVRDPVDGDGDLDDEDPDPAPPLGGGSAGTGGDDSDEENDGDDNNNGVDGDDNVSEDDDDDDNDRDNNGIDDDDRGTARGPRDGPRRPRRGGRVSDPDVRDGDDARRNGGRGNGNGSNGNGNNRNRSGSGSNNRLRVAASQVLIALGNGDGTFDAAQSVTSATLFGVSRIRVGDFNNDGNDDLRVRARNTNSKGKPTTDGGRHVWITFNGEGDGTFSRSADDVTA